MSESFMSAMFLVGLSEVGDKTQLAVLALSTQSRRRLFVVSGAMLAFLLANSIVAFSGEVVSRLVPPDYIRLFSALLFSLFGLYYLTRAEGEKEGLGLKDNPFLQAFGVVFVSEMGDKTQIATGLLAARYGDPVSVLIGAMVSLGVVTILSVLVGSQLYRLIPTSHLRKLAGLAFIISGIVSLII